MPLPPVPSVRLGLLVACLAAALSGPGCLAPTNPYDPATPASEQARAKLEGTVSDGSGPVAGAQVQLGADIQETGDNGSYLFDDVVPGTHALSVEHPTHERFERDVTLAAAQRRTIDVQLAKLASGSRLHGIARKAAEVGDADQDMSGILVELEGVVGARTVTNVAGVWDMLVADGSYTLLVSASEHLSATVPNVVVDGDTEVDTVTLAVNPGSVTGVVTLADLVPGTPIHGGVLVTIGNATQVTGVDDSYQITGLGAGAAVVRFTRADYVTVEKPIVVESGALTTVDPVQLVRATGGVTGTVDLNGADDNSATVTLSGASGVFVAGSAASGAFFFTDVPSGSYTLAATREGFVPADGGLVDVVAGAVATVGTLTLSPLIGDFAVNGGEPFTNSRTVDVVIQSDDAVDMRLSELSDFSDAIPVTFDPSTVFTLTSAGDGPKTIYLELIDANDVATGPFSAGIFLDTTPPANLGIAINPGGATPGFSNDPNGVVALALSATDTDGSGVAEMQIDTDGSFSAPFQSFTTGLSFPILPPTEVLHVLSARFRDRAGNETSIQDAVSESVTLDRTAPVVEALTLTDTQTGRSDFATRSEVTMETARAVGSEDATLMAVSTDGLFPVEVFEPFVAQRAFTLLPGQGSRAAAVKLMDAAGNKSNARTDTIVVDSIAPANALVRLADGADATSSAIVSISLVADSFAEVRTSLDGVFDAPGEQYVDADVAPTTIDVGLGGDGPKTVFAQFRDAAGNESAVVSDGVLLDETPPVLDADPALTGDAIVIAFDGTTEGAAFSNSVSVTVSFDVDGADEVAFTTDGVVDANDAFQPFSAVITVLLPAGDCDALDDACKSVCAVFRDDAGNTTTQVCDGIGLDTTPPAAPLFVEQDSVVALSAQTLHLEEKVEDVFFDHYELLISPGAPVFTPIDVGAPNGGAVPFDVDLTSPTPGTLAAAAAERNLLRMVAVDRAGNVSPESALTIVVDDVPPDPPELANMPTDVNADTVSVNFLVSNPADDDATFHHYVITTTLLPAPFDTFQRDGIVVGLKPDEENTIVVQAVDAAGNVSTPSPTATDVGTVREDSTPPTAPSIAPAGGAVRSDVVEIYLSHPAEDTYDSDGIGGVPPEREDLTRYDLKDGRGLGFQRQPEGSGPFRAFLQRNGTNEICVRGIDRAGNESDSDCIAVDEESARVMVDTTDRPHSADLFGDFLVFLGNANLPIVRDLAGAESDNLLDECCAPAASGDVRVVGDGRRLRVMYEANAGPGAHVVALRIADVDRDGSENSISTDSFPGSLANIGTSLPFAQGFEIVYAVDGAPGTVDLRRRPAELPIVADSAVASGVVLCQGTSPVVDSGIVVWCEDQGGGSRVVRRQLTPNGPIDTVSRLGRSVPFERQAFFAQGGPEVAQPVITETMIAWVEDVGGAPRLVILDDPNESPAVPIQVTNVDGEALEVDAIADASGSLLALLQRTTGAVSTDVFVVNAIAQTMVQLTDDLPPQKNITIDGKRVSFQDSSRGQSVIVVDLTQQRWLSGSAELGLSPQVSGDAAAWIETRGEVLRLFARATTQGSPIVAVDEPPALGVAFGGGSREDERWAVGGSVVAWLSAGGSPGPFSLTVKELNTGARVTVATDVAGAIAMDPDGDQIVYVDASNRVLRSPLVFTPPATLTAGPPVVVESVAPGTHLLFTDVDDDVVVWQEGGQFGESGASGTLKCQNTAGGSVTQVIPLGGTIPNLGRGPKLGKRGALKLLAYHENGDVPFVCPFSCTPSATTCTPRLAASTQSPSAGHSNVMIGRDGVVAYISSVLNGSQDIALFDPFVGRRVFLTTDDGDQDGLCLSSGHVVYSDTVLGNLDIWELRY